MPPARQSPVVNLPAPPLASQRPLASGPPDAASILRPPALRSILRGPARCNRGFAPGCPVSAACCAGGCLLRRRCLAWACWRSASLYWLIAPRLPDVQNLRHVACRCRCSVYSARRQADRAVRRDAPLPGQDRDRSRCSVKQAFIAIEDARFYEHHGLDFHGIAPRGLAARHHRRQARAGRQHDHPAGREQLLPELRIQLHAAS